MALVVFVPTGGWWVADRYGLCGVLPQMWWALSPHIAGVHALPNLRKVCFWANCVDNGRLCVGGNVMFLVEFLTLWVPFLSSSGWVAAKNRFSRELFLVQNGALCITSYLHIYVVLNATLCWMAAVWCEYHAICGKMYCVLVQNRLRFGANCSAFWCKMQGNLLLNALWFAPKWEAKCIKMLWM